MTRYGDLFGGSDWPTYDGQFVSPAAQTYADLVIGSTDVEGAPGFTQSLRALVASAFQAGIYHEQGRALRGKESS